MAKFNRDDAKHALVVLQGHTTGENHEPGELITEAREFHDPVTGLLMYERYTGRRCSTCREVYFKEIHELRKA